MPPTYLLESRRESCHQHPLTAYIWGALDFSCLSLRIKFTDILRANDLNSPWCGPRAAQFYNFPWMLQLSKGLVQVLTFLSITNSYDYYLLFISAIY